MTNGEKKVGSIFKEKREELNLSLKEVESSTSIRTSYLDAIESGGASRLISKVYMHGFMRQYADYLNLNVEKLSLDYPEVFKIPDYNQEFSYGIGTLESLNRTSHKVSIVPNLLWGGGFILMMVMAWWFAKALGLFS